MSHVEISANDHRFIQPFFKLGLEEVLEVFVPLIHTIVESFETLHARVWNVARHENKLVEVTSHCSSFLIMNTLSTEIVLNFRRYAARKVLADQYGTSGVALLGLRMVPKLQTWRKPLGELLLDLLFLQGCSVNLGLV